MARLGSYFRRLFFWSQREQKASELHDEIAQHIEEKTAANIATGMPPREARQAAVRQFGNSLLAVEHSRDHWGFAWLEAFLHDIRFGARLLLKSRGFTLVAVAALALGIGANTAMFSVLNTVILRPLPFPEPERLVVLQEVWKDHGSWAVSPPDFLDWRQQSRSFDGIFASNGGSWALSGGGEPRHVEGLQVTPDFLKVLGVQPMLGRGFVEEEGQRGHDHVALLSHRLWQQNFSADTSIVGKTVHLDREEYVIIGVMPADFQYPLRGSDLWIPLSFGPKVYSQRGAHWLSVVGRVKPGVSIAQASQDVAGLSRQFKQLYPNTNGNWDGEAIPLRESLIGDVRPGLSLLFGAVVCVVLIACANVANLLLARGKLREREIATRAALGASGSRISRQLLTESALLSVMSAAVGVLLARWGLQLIVKLGPKDIPRLSQVGIDGPVLLFALLLALLTAFAFGLLPALRSAHRDLHDFIKSAGRGSTGGRETHALRSALVVAEVAGSLVLLVGAGLLIRSFERLQRVDPGFDPDHVLTFSLSLPDVAYKTSTQMQAFWDDYFRRLESQPGVTSVGAIFPLPLSGDGFSGSYSLGGAPEDEESSMQERFASADYLRTMKIPLVRGRWFTAQDQLDAPRVLVASESAARKLWPGQDPIGQKIAFGARPGNEKVEGTVVGVVGDVHDFGLARNPTPVVYAPLDQVGLGSAWVVVKTSLPPAQAISGVRSQLRAIDPELTDAETTTMDAVVSGSVSQRQFYMLMLGLFAGVAIALAVIGIYGVIAYAVSQRTQEIGIRIALGAPRASVLAMVLREALGLVGIGLGCGLVVSLFLTRTLDSLLFRVGQHDPVTLALVSGAIGVTALLAAWVPAMRATRVDPMVALRYE